MAVYFRHACTECGEQAVNDEKSKSFVHAYEKRGNKASHKVPSVKAIRMDEVAA